jgi:uncharacterized membrane protein
MKASSDAAASIESAADERVRRVELIISTLLRVGVLVSLALIVIGTIVSFVHHPDYFTSAANFNRLTAPGAAFPHTLNGVLEGLGAASGQAIVMLGLLVLIATPVLRVAVSIFAFVYQEDWLFMGITALVLLLLLFSFVLGKVE